MIDDPIDDCMIKTQMRLYTFKSKTMKSAPSSTKAPTVAAATNVKDNTQASPSSLLDMIRNMKGNGRELIIKLFSNVKMMMKTIVIQYPISSLSLTVMVIVFLSVLLKELYERSSFLDLDLNGGIKSLTFKSSSTTKKRKYKRNRHGDDDDEDDNDDGTSILALFRNMFGQRFGSTGAAGIRNKQERRVKWSDELGLPLFNTVNFNSLSNALVSKARLSVDGDDSEGLNGVEKTDILREESSIGFDDNNDEDDENLSDGKVSIKNMSRSDIKSSEDIGQNNRRLVAVSSILLLKNHFQQHIQDEMNKEKKNKNNNNKQQQQSNKNGNQVQRSDNGLDGYGNEDAFDFVPSDEVDDKMEEEKNSLEIESKEEAVSNNENEKLQDTREEAISQSIEMQNPQDVEENKDTSNGGETFQQQQDEQPPVSFHHENEDVNHHPEKIDSQITESPADNAINSNHNAPQPIEEKSNKMEETQKEEKVTNNMNKNNEDDVEEEQEDVQVTISAVAASASGGGDFGWFVPEDDDEQNDEDDDPMVGDDE